jgi:hypothetical protein
MVGDELAMRRHIGPGNGKNEQGRTSGRGAEVEVYEEGDSQQRTFGEGGQGGIGSIHCPPSPARCWATAGRLAVYSIELSVYSVLYWESSLICVKLV